jgi:amino acid transporter
VVGGSGLYAALGIILLANAISVLTSFSVAAVATNLKVKGGGDYYLISRTLGVGFGGAIGIVLFLAQSVSVGFYAIGFGEAVAGLLGQQHGWAVQAVAGGAVVALFVLAWLGADWASRFQYVVMGLIIAALVSFTIGAFGLFSTETLVSGLGRPVDGLPFWAAFAIFFPAVTGFTQGVSMSGDLRDPGRSIPVGTFLAVGLSIVVYLGVAVLLAGSMPLGFLSIDNAAMNRIAAFSPLIDAGVIAATLSSALASFLGAPRILQALASDEVFPPLNAFAHGSGPTNNPRRGVLLSGGIALGVVAIGNLNLIASVVSMFFLVSYGLLNYATYYEANTNSPSFRPSFRFYDRRLSLIGGLGCLGAILAIDVAAGLVAVAVVFAIYQYLTYKAPAVGWSDSRRSHHLRQARYHLLAAAREPAHPRDWRPQILLFSADSRRRARLLQFADWVAGDTGLTTAVQVIEGSGPGMLEKREEVFTTLSEELNDSGYKAFPLVATAPELDAAVATVIQSAGIGPVQVNTVLANWIKGRPALFGDAAVGRYGRNLRTAFRLGRNLLVLDSDTAEWEQLARHESRKRRIDVWWRQNQTGEFMLLLAYLMTRHEDWEEAKVRVLVPLEEGEDSQTRVDTINEFLGEVRIKAEPVVVENADADTMVAQSEDASFVFLPISIHAGYFYDPFGGDVADLLPRLQIVAMALAAQDVDLSADPDEGSDEEETEEDAVPDERPEAGEDVDEGSLDTGQERD